MTGSPRLASSTGLLRGAQMVSGDVLARLAERADEVDGCATADQRPTLRELADHGVLDLGLPGGAGGYADQARVLAELASVCMTAAFSAWAHRMAVEYLVLHGGDGLADLADQVRRVQRPGSTALAGALRAAAGVADMPVTSHPLPTGGLRCEGLITWASNLYPDAVVVTGVGAVGVADDRRLVALDRSAPGVEVQEVSGLMALDASHSGVVRLDGVEVAPHRVLATPFEEIIAAIRPVFLVLQSAFALGLASASLAAVGEPVGPAAVLGARVETERAALAALAGDLDAAASLLDAGERPDLRAALELRLGASHLATRATQLELAVRGGSGYRSTSATARRVREALFLPVQSPTEVQLQWELAQWS